MTQANASDARNKAGGYYKRGFSCAESILLAGRELLAPEWDLQILKMATPFGGGLGRAGCICGALSASMMVLGMLHGRTNCDVDRSGVGQHAARIHSLFLETFGSTCCSVLNHNEFDNNSHYVRCLKIGGRTAELLFKCLMEQDLLVEAKENNV
jgi:C_GCAxxG_C_C family probable redox protein